MKILKGEMKNRDVRESMKKAGIPQWKLAERLGVSEATVQRMLRQELPEDKKEVIRGTITRIVTK